MKESPVQGPVPGVHRTTPRDAISSSVQDSAAGTLAPAHHHAHEHDHGPGPLAFFLAMQQAFSDTAARHRQSPRLIDAMLGQAFDSFDGNLRIQTEGEREVDCARGCAACCTLRVTATAPEVMLVARFLRKVQPLLAPRGIDLVGGVRAAHAITAGLDAESRVRLRQRCPFVAQGACVIYQVRPLACRGHASHDRQACADAAAGRRDEVPVSEPHRIVRSVVQNSMQSALRDAGLAWGTYELNEALCLALDDERWADAPADASTASTSVLAQQRLEAAWLAGEDVFASAADQSVSVDEMNGVFDQLTIEAEKASLQPHHHTCGR